LHCLVHEVFYDFLTPRSEGSAAEPTTKAANAGKADAAKLPRIAVQHVDADFREDVGNIRFLLGLEVVISEDGDNGNLRWREIFGEDARLVGEPVVGEISADGEDVRGFSDLREQRRQGALRALRVVNVAQRREAHDVSGRHTVDR